MIRSSELSAPLSHPPQKGEGLEIELIIDNDYIMKPPFKKNVPQLQGLESFWFGQHMHVLGGWCSPNSTGTEALMLETFLDLGLSAF